jgi:hypothetical protein
VRVQPLVYEGQVTRITYAADTPYQRHEYLGYDGPELTRLPL